MRQATLAVCMMFLLALVGSAKAGEDAFPFLSRMNEEATGDDALTYYPDHAYYELLAGSQDAWWSGADSDEGVLFAYNLLPAAGNIEITIRQAAYHEWDGAVWNPDLGRPNVQPHAGIMLRNYTDLDGNDRPDNTAMFLSVGGAAGAYSASPGLARMDDTGSSSEVAAIPDGHDWFRLSLDVGNSLGRISASDDGDDWTQYGGDINFTGIWGSQLAAGMYIASDYDGHAVSGFDNVSIETDVVQWDVTDSGTWDTVTANWNGQTYSEGDNVIISRDAGGTNTITIDRDGNGTNGDVNPGSTMLAVDNGTVQFEGGRIQSGPVVKTGSGTVEFSGYNQSFDFSSLTIEGGEFRYQDSGDNPLGNNDVIQLGTGAITLDNGGILGISHREGGNPGVTVTNDIVIGAGGGEVNTDRRTGNPRTVFSGDVTLGGDLLLSKGGGGNSEPSQTYAGTITITGGDRAIRGASNFNNGTHPVIAGNIVDDGTPRQLTLAMATGGRRFVISGTGNTYSGGTVIESGAGFIRVLAESSLGTGDVTVLSGGELRLEGYANIADTATLWIEDGGLVDLDFMETMDLYGLTLAGDEVPLGTFVDAGSHPDFFSGDGQIQVIPEPATMVLLGLGGVALLKRRGRRA